MAVIVKGVGMHTSPPLQDIHDSYENLTKEELDNLGIVLGAYRSFRGDRRKHIAYVSMPITTGKRLYEVFAEERVKSVDELTEKHGKDALWKMVIQPNIREGVGLADSLGLSHDLLFIAPSVFEAKKWRWSQDAYMSLWYRVLGEMAGSHFLMDGWEYSTGGLKEVFFSLLMQWRVIRPHHLNTVAREYGLKNFYPDMPPTELAGELEAMSGIRLFNEDGNEINIDQALSIGVSAVESLRDNGLPYEDLLWPVVNMAKIPFFSRYFMAQEYAPHEMWTAEYFDAQKRIDQIRRVQSSNSSN